MPEPSKISGIKIALAVIPALLIVSICVALYLGANADQEEAKPLEGDITVPEMSDYLLKLNNLIGEREIGTEAGQKAFRRLNAMTAGTLGSENLGQTVNDYHIYIYHRPTGESYDQLIGIQKLTSKDLL